MSDTPFKERRKHRRLPMVDNLAEPLEILILNENNKIVRIPGIVTNLSAGGLVLVLMGSVKDAPKAKLSLQLPGLDRFEVEAKVVWTKAKGPTEIVGFQFLDIDKKHVDQINHLAEEHHKKAGNKKKEPAPSLN